MARGTDRNPRVPTEAPQRINTVDLTAITPRPQPEPETDQDESPTAARLEAAIKDISNYGKEQRQRGDHLLRMLILLVGIEVGVGIAVLAWAVLR